MMVENICGQPMPSPHSGSLWSAQIPSLPFQGRWLGEAETERSQQICYDLSVTFGDSSPERGALGACKSIRNPMQKGAA